MQAKAPKPMKKIVGATPGTAKPATPAKPPTMASLVIAESKAMSYKDDSRSKMIATVATSPAKTKTVTTAAATVVIDVDMEDSVLNRVPHTPSTPDP